MGHPLKAYLISSHRRRDNYVSVRAYDVAGNTNTLMMPSL